MQIDSMASRHLISDVVAPSRFVRSASICVVVKKICVELLMRGDAAGVMYMGRVSVCVSHASARRMCAARGPSCDLGLLGTKVATGHEAPLVLTLAVSPTPAWYLQGDPYSYIYSSLMFRNRLSRVQQTAPRPNVFTSAACL